jgi:galactose-1-phosphate uridylyltransferase
VKGYGPRDLVKDQKIIKVTNKVIYEEVLFNDLRSRRPFQARESIDVVKEIKNTEDCFFCIPQVFYLTPDGVFLPGGRAEERSLQPPISRALMPTGRPWKPWR